MDLSVFKPNNISAYMYRLLAPITISTLLLLNPLKSQELYGEFTLGYNFNTSKSRITNIPSYMRQISPNPVAIGFDAPNPVLEDDITLGSTMDVIGLKVGERKSFLEDKVRLSVGVGIDFVNYLFHSEENSHNKYYNPEGVGHNYVYNEIGYAYLFKWNNVARPKIYSEIEFKISDYINVTTGYELTTQEIFLENGWVGDQHPDGTWGLWADSEIHQRYILAQNMTIGKPYIAIDINENNTIPGLCGFKILLGKSQSLNKASGPATIHYTNDWTFGINIAAKVPLTK